MRILTTAKCAGYLLPRTRSMICNLPRRVNPRRVRLRDWLALDGQMRTGGATARLGFTLIELLVITGVIGLLVSILLPSLARSRESTRAVICRSNLKQLGSAMLMYANQNKEALPFEERPDPRLGMGSRGETEDADGDKVWDDLPGEKRGWICWFDVLDSYLGGKQVDEGVKVCPTVRRRESYAEESYRMNSKLADHARYRPAGSTTKNPYYMPYRRIYTLHWPARTALLFDGETGSGGEANAPPSFKGRWRLSSITGVKDDVNYRHARCSNLVFVDWHIETIIRNVMKDRSFDNKGIIWQPPDMGTWNPAPVSND